MLFNVGFDRAIERLLRRDRQVVILGLILLVALAWTYLYYLALQMNISSMEPNQAGSSAMQMSDMVKLTTWSAADALLMFVMWSIMMLGMMTPSATPMVLLYAHLVRHNAKDAEPLVHTGAFFAGYLVTWIVFSFVATVLQWCLEQAALLSPMMVSTSPIFGGLVLLVAAVYQWTPYKDACLRRCRSLANGPAPELRNMGRAHRPPVPARLRRPHGLATGAGQGSGPAGLGYRPQDPVRRGD